MTSRARRARSANRPVARTLRRLGRHNVAAIIASGVDIGLMIVLVERFGLSPAVATMCAVIGGGVVSFLLGRRWVFGARGAVLPQAMRYALASLIGATLNAAGVFILHERGGVQYVVARLLVAAVVSLFWNYPMHRRFVFRRKRSGADPIGPCERSVA